MGSVQAPQNAMRPQDGVAEREGLRATVPATGRVASAATTIAPEVRNSTDSKDAASVIQNSLLQRCKGALGPDICVRDIISTIDTNHDGRVNKRELIKALRESRDIAEFFGLPRTIRQEDGSRDALERVFQAIDANGDRDITAEELLTYHGIASFDAAHVTRSPEPAAAKP